MASRGDPQPNPVRLWQLERRVEKVEAKLFQLIDMWAADIGARATRRKRDAAAEMDEPIVEGNE